MSVCGTRDINSYSLLFTFYNKKGISMSLPQKGKVCRNSEFLPTPREGITYLSGEPAPAFSLSILLQLASPQDTCILGCLVVSLDKQALPYIVRSLQLCRISKSEGHFRKLIWPQVKPHCSGQLYE